MTTPDQQAADRQDLVRYAVRVVRGMGCGAGMFAVVDRETGGDCGQYQYNRDDAEQRARRLNAEARNVESD